ncbi:MAG: hypothetical protein F6K03_03170 [Kamptonema sp. SIO4C4]|nr:hypothetical protein [Kamptonema sp. SIO4C4]
MGIETILASVFLSISTNLDNLAVGTAYGMRQLTIGWWGNVLIAALSGISTFFSMSFGDWVEDFLTPAIAQQMGGGIICAIGGVVVWNTLREVEQPDLPTTQPQKRISLSQALLLGLALTITNWGTGIGAGIINLNSGLTSSFSFLSSLFTIGGGVLLGQWANRQLASNWLSWLSGLGLIGLGVYEGFGSHLS